MLMTIQIVRLVVKCKRKYDTQSCTYHTQTDQNKNKAYTQTSRHARQAHLHGIGQRRLRLLQRRVRGGDGARHLAVRLERAETRLVIGAEILSARAHAHKPIHASRIFKNKTCKNMI